MVMINCCSHNMTHNKGSKKTQLLHVLLHIIDLMLLIHPYQLLINYRLLAQFHGVLNTMESRNVSLLYYYMNAKERHNSP